MKYYPKLESTRVHLSPMNPDDYELYWEWINDLSTSIPIGSGHRHYTKMAEKEALSELAKGQAFAIVRNSDEKLLGNCSLFDINQLHRHGTLGIFIGDKEERNKGYGTEAMSLLLDYGFKILNLNNIMLQVFAFNERGIAAYKKLGFIEFGRRHEIYFLDGHYYDELFMEVLAKDYQGTVLDETINNIING